MNSFGRFLNQYCTKLVHFLMKQQFRIVALLLLTCLGFNSQASNSVVVVFYQDTTENFADGDFLKNYYPKLVSYASENDIELELRNVENGAPEGLVNTPSIHYYGNEKHTVFKGRYTEVQRMQSWITVSSIAPIKNKPFTVENAFLGVLTNGNTYAFPIKVIPHFDESSSKKSFVSSDQITNAFQDNFSNDESTFEYQNEITLPYQNRKYYLDFYPYVTNKKMYVTVKVFSEFHCKIPVFETKVPLESGIKKWKELVVESKKLAMLKVKKLIESGINGDAHTAFSAKGYPVLLAKDFGLVDEKEAFGRKFEPLSNDWEFDSENGEGKLQFLVPNTIYTGEIEQFKITLELDEMHGNARAKLKSLNTGDVGLDYSIMDRILAEKYSMSSLVFKEALLKPDTEIDAWDSYNYTMLCGFTFAGKTVEETVDLVLTPIYNEKENKTELFCYAHFSILMMRQFGIESGVGDSEEEDTVEFYLNFKLKSK